MIEFERCPTYAHNSAFSPPAEIIMIMIVIIGAEIIIIITIGLQIIIANRIANYNCKSQFGLQFIEFGPRPTYAHNSAFSPPAEIMNMIIIMVIIGANIVNDRNELGGLSESR